MDFIQVFCVHFYTHLCLYIFMYNFTTWTDLCVEKHHFYFIILKTMICFLIFFDVIIILLCIIINTNLNTLWVFMQSNIIFFYHGPGHLIISLVILWSSDCLWILFDPEQLSLILSLLFDIKVVLKLSLQTWNWQFDLESTIFPRKLVSLAREIILQGHKLRIRVLLVLDPSLF